MLQSCTRYEIYQVIYIFGQKYLNVFEYTHFKYSSCITGQFCVREANAEP